MQTWAKRGLQSALVTGGLLMLGTGIASAEERVSPDLAPSMLDSIGQELADVDIEIPVLVEKNAIGVLGDAVELPEIDEKLVVPSLNTMMGKQSNPLVKDSRGIGSDQIIRNNRIVGDLVVPVMVCGNAIGALGDAYVEADCEQEASSTRTTITDGSRDSLAGNVVAIAAAVPTSVTGNAIAGLGNAEANTTASQSAVAGGDITTSGERGSLSGNVVAGQWAVPVQLNNNAVGTIGNALANGSSDVTAEVPGTITTSGADSFGGGNALLAPLAPIAAVNGNAAGVLGNGDVLAENSATATAGSEHTGIFDLPTYAETSGNRGTLAGNILQPQIAGPISADDNAVVVAGNSTATSSASNYSQVGGFTSTTGENGTLSGSIGDLPIGLPAAVGGNGAAVLGNAAADHTNDSTTLVGGNTFTNGDGAVLGSNVVSAPVTVPADLCGTGLSAGGNADGNCNNLVTTEVGGLNASRGNDSVVSGNLVSLPSFVPAESFGNAFSVLGQADGTADEVKGSAVGGEPNTRDDDGTVSSNAVGLPTALGLQMHSMAGGILSNTNATATSDSTFDVGGPAEATGKHGSISGNIAYAPTNNIAQLFGSAVGVGGNHYSNSDNFLTSTVGGDAVSTGEDGAIAGNVASVPLASTLQSFGHSVVVAGNGDVVTSNTADVTTGGDVATNGDNASVSGNGIAPQIGLPAQVFGIAGGVAGNGNTTHTNDSTLVVGGDHDTSGLDSAASGMLVTAPISGSPAVHGDAVSVLGLADSVTDSTALTQVGGSTETVGSGSLSAAEVYAPVEAAATVVDVPAQVLGTATTLVSSTHEVETGDEVDGAGDTKGINLPSSVDRHLSITSLPLLNNVFMMERSFQGDLPVVGGLAGGLPVVGGLTGGLPVGNLTGGGLPLVGGLTGGLPGISGRSAQGGGLPVVGGLTGGGLPVVGGLTQGGLPLVGGLTGGGLPVVGGLTQGGLPLVGGLTGGQRSSAPTLPTDQLTKATSGLKVNPLEQLGGQKGGSPLGSLLAIPSMFGSL
ncbi:MULTISPECIES: hypothetical protein [Actinosynnema]|uniref:beta strand repeat-containing protein n=1 Tax=Actinosynnema TaxID=40566 RepID=UPI0020A57950|nr:hypothetical protein [Actinosynnema pretiosum]MCP2093554.1 hypothetical protein [Actinosynnema pretiosum]